MTASCGKRYERVQTQIHAPRVWTSYAQALDTPRHARSPVQAPGPVRRWLPLPPAARPRVPARAPSRSAAAPAARRSAPRPAPPPLGR